MASLKALCEKLATSSNRDAAEIFAEFWDPQPSAAAERSIDTDGAWPLSTELHHFIGKDIVNFHGLFWPAMLRSEEHTSELQSLMRISYAVFRLKKNKHTHSDRTQHEH